MQTSSSHQDLQQRKQMSTKTLSSSSVSVPTMGADCQRKTCQTKHPAPIPISLAPNHLTTLIPKQNCVRSMTYTSPLPRKSRREPKPGGLHALCHPWRTQWPWHGRMCPNVSSHGCGCPQYADLEGAEPSWYGPGTVLHTPALTPSLFSRGASKAQASSTSLKLALEVPQSCFSHAHGQIPWLSPAFLHATSSRQRVAEFGYAPSRET